MSSYGEWQSVKFAPRDGTRVLVAIRETEQGPAEVDVARWARAVPAAEPCWISADSDAVCVIAYQDAELVSWMPMPSALPKLRAGLAGSGLPDLPPREAETAGSGI